MSTLLLMEDQFPGIVATLKNFGWRQWKWVFLFTLFLIIIIIAIGSSSTLSTTESSDILEQLKSQLPKVDTAPIFVNNFLIAAFMFVPILGPAAGVIILHTTGVVIAASSVSANLPGVFILLGLLVLPFTWLEFISYSIAMTQSIFLTLGFFRRSLKKELRRTAFLLIVVFIMLLVAAFIETFLIKSLQNPSLTPLP